MCEKLDLKILTLKNPGTTRWDGESICINSVYNVKVAIQALANEDLSKNGFEARCLQRYHCKLLKRALTVLEPLKTNIWKCLKVRKSLS